MRSALALSGGATLSLPRFRDYSVFGKQLFFERRMRHA